MGGKKKVGRLSYADLACLLTPGEKRWHGVKENGYPQEEEKVWDHVWGATIEPEEFVEEEPKKKPPGRPNPWAPILDRVILPLRPGERAELGQNDPPRWPPRTFLDHVKARIKRHLGPVSPWTYRCTLTKRMTVLVEVMP